MMGSGGMIVMDEDNCMVDVARFFLEFTVDESCGKCPPCRIGTKRMLELLEKICNNEGEEGDIEVLENSAATIKASALCALGQTAPNPVLSTLRYFRHEYDAHIKDRRCPAVYARLSCAMSSIRRNARNAIFVLKIVLQMRSLADRKKFIISTPIFVLNAVCV
jgi:NADP-reducing hydrogenase subunit HndC